VSQVLNFPATAQPTTYTLWFYTCGRPGYASNTVVVTIASGNHTLLSTSTTPPQSWILFQVQFTAPAAGGVYTLTLAGGVSDGNYCTAVSGLSIGADAAECPLQYLDPLNSADNVNAFPPQRLMPTQYGGALSLEWCCCYGCEQEQWQYGAFSVSSWLYIDPSTLTAQEPVSNVFPLLQCGSSLTSNADLFAVGFSSKSLCHHTARLFPHLSLVLGCAARVRGFPSSIWLGSLAATLTFLVHSLALFLCPSLPVFSRPFSHGPHMLHSIHCQCHTSTLVISAFRSTRTTRRATASATRRATTTACRSTR
jgi:hypothetical protein